jgi:chitinase
LLPSIFSLKRIFIITFLYAILILFNNLIAAQEKIIGYYASWNSNLLPYNKIEYSNLTDINVAFGVPDSDGTITYDGGIPFTRLVDAAHTAGIKVLISLGGASSGSNFAEATLDSSHRAILISNIVNFLRTNFYDGVDIDWEFPANATETSQLTSLIQEMRNEFNKVNSSWLITMAIPAQSSDGQHFDIRNLVSYVDWFNVMCYDFVGSWTDYSGFNAPLYEIPIDPNQAGSDSTAIEYWLSRGSRQITIPSSKLVLGIPFYGDMFNVSGLYKKLINATVSNPSYEDDISYMTSGWTRYWYDATKEPYLINSDTTQFITYEDTNSVKLKAEFAMRNGLNGIMVWEISRDLYNGKQPLLEALSRTIVGLTSIKNVDKNLINNYVLYNNYPNPFNPSTIIRFSVPKESYVKLVVYDILGREVGLFFNKEVMPGTYQVTFNASTLSSGIYLYSLISGSFRITKKMLLIK